MERCQKSILREMRGAGVEEKVIKQCERSIEAIPSPFFGLTSKYLRDKYLENNVVTIKAREIIMGHQLCHKNRNGIMKLEEVPEYAAYISIIETFQEMLGNSELTTELKNIYQTGKQDVFYDVLDGSFFKGRIDNDDFIEFKILIFQDAVEVCNPLGNRNGKHKVVMFYWTLVNISPKLRSRLSAIKLLAIVEKTKIDKYGFERVLQPFVEEMKQLYEGMDFLVGDQIVKCRGKVLLCLGDTEGQQQIGGFKVSVGWSLRKCRYCLATAEDVRNNFTPSTFNKRNKETHLRQCKEIDNAPAECIKKDLQTTYGILTRSCLLKLPEFDVTKQLPHDVMHVLLEGIVPYEIQLVLSSLMNDGYFSLSDFNHQLKIFQFSSNDVRSKPEPLKSSVFIQGERKLKYSAENSRVFLKILPFILSKFVEKEHSHYKFIMNLSSIVLIAFSPVISIGTCKLLEEQIISHLKTFKNLFPSNNLIPKHHYLLELPELIPMFGPPVRYGCMRFEALHKLFKSYIPVTSFRNICMSLSNKYLIHVSEPELQKSHSITNNIITHGPTKSISNDELNKDFSMHSNNFAYILKWVIIYGTRYDKKSIIAWGADEETQLPNFGSVANILLCDDTLYFVINIIITERFEESYNGYSVHQTEDQQIVQALQLLDFNTYQIVITENLCVIPLKYDLVDIIEEHIMGCNPLHEIMI